MNQKFEYDDRKSEANLAKHGIDFQEIQRVWDDPGMIAVRSDRFGERRYVGIGRIEGSCWTVIYTNRGETIRIISARRSTRGEESSYGKAN